MKRNLCLGLSLLSLTTPVLADYFPASQSTFYYRIGGGRNLAQPAVNQTHAMNLGVKGNIGLGYHCGAFDLKANITDTLNNVKDSIRNISSSVMSQATGAIVSFPMYTLMRTNPNLYNLLNNNLIGAQEQFAVQMKSCETMQAEALKGENPYDNWMRTSVGNQWKSQMWGDGGQGRQPNLSKAKHDVDKNPGRQGVPWIDGPAGTLAKPIYVISDTAKAGFNVVSLPRETVGLITERLCRSTISSFG